MKLSIAISGPAGAGVLSAGMLIGKLMAQKGYDVVGDKEYQSIIKGGNNTFINYISDEGKCISKQIDYFIYMDKYALEFNQKAYNIKNAIILPDEVKVNKNIFAIGIIANLVCASKKDFEGILKNKFGKKTFLPGILKAFEEGYTYAQEYVIPAKNSVIPAKKPVIPAKAGISKESNELIIDSPAVLRGNDKIPQEGQGNPKGQSLGTHDLCKFKAKPKKFMFGNQLIAQGASEAGLGYFSFYPMTPSTTISSELYKIKEKGDNKDLVIFQAENEISVAISMLGASFTGKSAMCATSGGGFALMVESISFSYIAEIGAVYILSQRDGPSTGSPTFLAQGDISFALNPSFGDIQPIVIYPSSIEEGYNLIGKALNRSQKYQNPIIFLLDKQFSECYYSVDEEDLKLDKESHIEYKQDKANYKRYELTKDGISPYMIPGTKGGEFIASSYEHDEYGTSTEDLDMKKKMMNKRVKKMDVFVKEEFNKDFQGYEIINAKAKKFFISFGINSIVLKDYISQNNDWGIILVKIFKPLDPRLIKFLNKNKNNIEKLVFVEHNQSGQFEEYIRTKAKLFNDGRDEKIDHIRKYNLYPFFIEEIAA